jgi:hypothetical protein
MIIKEIRLNKVSILTKIRFAIALKLMSNKNITNIQKYFKNCKILKFGN